jgi:hypothetical protein
MARIGPVPVPQCVLADAPDHYHSGARGSFAAGPVTGSALLVPR